jgi:hypothetical protein
MAPLWRCLYGGGINIAEGGKGSTDIMKQLTKLPWIWYYIVY